MYGQVRVLWDADVEGLVTLLKAKCSEEAKKGKNEASMTIADYIAGSDTTRGKTPKRLG